MSDTEIPVIVVVSHGWFTNPHVDEHKPRVGESVDAGIWDGGEWSATWFVGDELARSWRQLLTNATTWTRVISCTIDDNQLVDALNGHTISIEGTLRSEVVIIDKVAKTPTWHRVEELCRCTECVRKSFEEDVP